MRPLWKKKCDSSCVCVFFFFFFFYQYVSRLTDFYMSFCDEHTDIVLVCSYKMWLSLILCGKLFFYNYFV